MERVDLGLKRSDESNGSQAAFAAARFRRMFDFGMGNRVAPCCWLPHICYILRFNNYSDLRHTPIPLTIFPDTTRIYPSLEIYQFPDIISEVALSIVKPSCFILSNLLPITIVPDLAASVYLLFSEYKYSIRPDASLNIRISFIDSISSSIFSFITNPLIPTSGTKMLLFDSLSLPQATNPRTPIHTKNALFISASLVLVWGFKED